MFVYVERRVFTICPCTSNSYGYMGPLLFTQYSAVADNAYRSETAKRQYISRATDSNKCMYLFRSNIFSIVICMVDCKHIHQWAIANEWQDEWMLYTISWKHEYIPIICTNTFVNNIPNIVPSEYLNTDFVRVTITIFGLPRSASFANLTLLSRRYCSYQLFFFS